VLYFLLSDGRTDFVFTPNVGVALSYHFCELVSDGRFLLKRVSRKVLEILIAIFAVHIYEFVREFAVIDIRKVG